MSTINLPKRCDVLFTENQYRRIDNSYIEYKMEPEYRTSFNRLQLN